MCYTYVLATYYLYTNYMIPLQHQTIPQGECGDKLHPAARYLQRITANKVPS